MRSRTLTREELSLVQRMLANVLDGARITNNLSSRVVEAMNDGGMGSLRFLGGAPIRSAGKTIATATFADADGTPVSVTLVLDRLGDLYELDIWEADFSPVQRIPPADQVVVSS